MTGNPNFHLPVSGQYAGEMEQRQTGKERIVAGAETFLAVCRKQHKHCETPSERRKIKTKKHPKVLSFKPSSTLTD
jgi:ribosomal protein S21